MSALLEAVRQRGPRTKRDVEELLLELADSEDLKFRLSVLIATINQTVSPAPSATEPFPIIARDWEADKQSEVDATIALFKQKKINDIPLDFTDPAMWSSITAWSCLKYALFFSEKKPRILLPSFLAFIHTKLAALPPPSRRCPCPDISIPAECVRVAVERWRVYHRRPAALPRVEDDRHLARDFALRLGEADEAAIARQVLEGHFRSWLVPLLDHIHNNAFSCCVA